MKIAIIYTGGTIGCIDNPLRPMNKNEFKNLFDKLILNELDINIKVDFLDFEKTIDSSDITPKEWSEISKVVLSHYSEYDSFVILHGTDTMAYTTSFVSFVLEDIDKPIIFSGSQYPLFENNNIKKDSDGYKNLLGAINKATTDLNGVFLYFNDKLFNGNKVIKIDTNSYDAFYAINFTTKTKNISYVNKLKKIVAKNDYLINHINHTKVINFNAFISSYCDNSSLLANVLDSVLKNELDGIVLHSFGAGNFPKSNNHTLNVLKKYSQKLIIANSSQVLNSVVNSNLYNSGSWLNEVGCIDTLNMTYIATFVKLIYLITLKDFYEYDNKRIKELLVTNLYGELD